MPYVPARWGKFSWWVILSVVLCSHAFAEKIRIGVANHLISAGELLAQDKGYFRQEGIEVELVEFSLGKGALSAMLHNEVDFALVAETPLVHASLAGEHFSILATVARSRRALSFLGRRDRGIDEFNKVRGKKIGVTFGTNAEYFFETLRVIDGIPKNAVELVDVAAGELESSLVEGKVDGICAWEPIASSVKGALSTNIFQYEGKGAYEWNWNLATTKRFLADREADAVKVVRALVRSGEELEAKPKAGAAILEKRLGIPAPRLLMLLAGYEFKPELRQELILQLEAQARWFMDSEKKVMPNYLRYVDTHVLRQISPTFVTVVE